MSHEAPRTPLPIAILISGRGSNMVAFIEAVAAGQLDARIALVLSNNPDAAGLERAREAGIDTAVINHRDYARREDFDAAMVARLRQAGAELVILAGFMRILTSVFITAFRGQLLNIHPSLLPKYPGLNTHQRALDAGDSEAGVTVHFVTEELDGGPPVLQARVPVQPGDSADSLAARVIVEEHKIYPLAARWFVQGRLTLSEQGAFLDGKRLPDTGLTYQPDLDRAAT
ncbi:phosphoribosylglycinamide formyltransferase [Parahaliea aestuarii]|uniref:Phosphoribosylglycinamide formyltransferase n=1 Tax=Parahaliea aestuarii TaxID=1852021 RepID=A0A5C8ZMS9_9GAMM|nr:phosphoribosylglycinamide formyltransferase [Parahaliea aestuarii]TXS89768.1 phosphoribosylglycinamide formyltransferase [Parahaliea aestuarii]